MVEHRQHQRAPIDVPVVFVVNGSTERVPGRAKDVSLGGMYVQSSAPARFGLQLVVHVTFPGSKVAHAIPAVVRWTRAGEGMGLQFGLLGARETHAITEVARR
ncbi:MAG: PilZ domain-containing protein [Myxococcota bacterium]|nr:PilZ domain-containing protein [Myxococcota bacterium]